MKRRYEISDCHWEKIKDLLPGKEGDVGCTARDNRQFINGVLWILRSGAAWPDLLERYGKFNSVYRRYSRWCEKGVWGKIFSVLSADKDNEYLILDSSVVQAHSQSATYKKRARVGGAVGGLTSKIHMLCDALGNPVRFEITGGQVHDSQLAEKLIEGQETRYVLADKGYIKPSFIEKIEAMGAEAVIPKRANQNQKRNFDAFIYKDRNLVERLFSKLKHFRRVATRFDKKLINYRGFVALACSMILLR